MNSQAYSKCPICGAQGIRIDDEGTYHCTHCGSDFCNDKVIRIFKTKRIINDAKIKEQDVKAYEAETKRFVELNKVKNSRWHLTENDSDAIIIIAIVLIFVFCFGGAFLIQQNETSFHASESSFHGKDYGFVEKLAYDAGFKTVEVQAIEDLNSGFLDNRNHGKVIHVYIDGKTDFNKSASFSKNATVRITYHSDGRDHKTVMPYSNNDFRGKTPSMVEDMLRGVGFSTFEIKQVMDAKRDWFGNDNKNKVENVFIDGLNTYRKNQLVENDATIVIEYHDRID